MTTTTVTPDTISAATKAALPGDVLVMAPGDYPALAFKATWAKAAPGCTLRGGPDVRLDNFEGTEAHGWRFEGFGVRVLNRNSCLMNFNGCQRIVVIDVLFAGEDRTVGTGLKLTSCEDVTVGDCEFFSTKDGIAHVRCRNLEIHANHLHHLGQDAIKGGENVHDLRIVGNSIHDLSEANADIHPDAIQVWTSHSEGPCTDIVVIDNTYVRGEDGTPAQGIFITDEGGVGYDRVTVRGNAVNGGMYNGITLGGVRSGEVIDNFVCGMEGQGDMYNSLRFSGADGVVCRDNVYNMLVESNPNPDLTFENNTQVDIVPENDTSMLEAWQERNVIPVPPEPPGPCEPVAQPLRLLASRAQAGISVLKGLLESRRD